MPSGAYNENAYENVVLEVLRSVKWEYMYGPDIERDYSDPTLPDVFEYQVRKLNKGVPDEAVNDAIRQVCGTATRVCHTCSSARQVGWHLRNGWLASCRHWIPERACPLFDWPMALAGMLDSICRGVVCGNWRRADRASAILPASDSILSRWFDSFRGSRQLLHRILTPSSRSSPPIR